MMPLKVPVKPSSYKPLRYQFDIAHGVWLSRQPDGWLWLLGPGCVAAAVDIPDATNLSYKDDGLRLPAGGQLLIGRLNDFASPADRLQRKHSGRFRPNVVYHQHQEYRIGQNQLVCKQNSDSRLLKFTGANQGSSIWKNSAKPDSWLHDYASWYANARVLPLQPGNEILGLLHFLKLNHADLLPVFCRSAYSSIARQFTTSVQLLAKFSATKLQAYTKQSVEFGWWLAHQEAVSMLIEGRQFLGEKDNQILQHFMQLRAKFNKPVLINHRLAWFDNFLAHNQPSLNWPPKGWTDITNCFMKSKNVNM